MASSSSVASYSQYCPRWKYDVFISFRGDDTRKGFTSHLYECLKNRGIHTFQDEKRLEKGDSIPEELSKAIEESEVALLVFSRNYATSKWCLNELLKIMKCKEEENRGIVIPIFFDVDPSHVRKQEESFAKAFNKHEAEYKDDAEGMQKVQAWRTALTAAANLGGYDVRNAIESEIIQQIADLISSQYCKSSRSLSFLQDIVGINAHLEKIKSQLQLEINDVRVLGIWGIGGIGKTTIANALFETLSYQFKGACFLANVKENARKNGLHSLQNTLVSTLLRKKDDYVDYELDSIIRSRLSSMKVLIVLDDIDHGDHLDCLAGDVGWFGNGSRVIVTTRDRHLIKKYNAIYEVSNLPDHEAMQLFNKHAFKKEVPNERFKEMSLEVVDHAKGLPLALKVWGCLLHNKGLPQWRRTVDHIKKSSNSEIVEKLKISYDGLEREEQKIFLDIACFFRGCGRTYVMKIHESCGFEAEYGLDVLIDKSLVFISEYDSIEMHDLIEDMGKYILKMQKDSGKPSRIWDFEDFKEVMADNTGAMAVEAIRFFYLENLCFYKEDMRNMQRLRIFIAHTGSEENDGSIDYLPNNLCWFAWLGYPWKLLPQTFNPTRLVHIELQGSLLHHLWDEPKQLLSLRRLEISYSKSLKRTPDFMGMPNLEYLGLRGCESLEEVHHSLGCCSKLIELDLFKCKNLKRFPYVNVESLISLNLKYCFSLEKLPEFLGIMRPDLKIEMSFCGIREIPSSIIHLLAHLTMLNLSGIHNLVSLPSSICQLKHLVVLNVLRCSKLETLPEGIGDLERLELLDARYTLISRPPSSVVRLNKLKVLNFAKTKSGDRAYFVFPQVNEGLVSLEELDLSCCNLIDGGLPEDIGCLSSLKKLDLSGNNFEHLPRSIAQLGALQSLSLYCCKKLKEVPCFTGMPYLDTLNLSLCNLIDEGLPEDIGCLSSLKELYLCGNNFEHLPRSIAQLGALQSLDLSHCERLKELPEFPQQLGRIDVDWDNDLICKSLFQNISSLQHDISASDSLSLRVFTSWSWSIPSWFHYRGTGRSVSVNLPENWYVSDNFLGFAVCCIDLLSDDITAHLIPLCDDGMWWMTQKFALCKHSENFDNHHIYFVLVPFADLWDASKAHGKMPNDYGCFRLVSTGESTKFGVSLLYTDELQIGMRSRDEEGSCSSSCESIELSFSEELECGVGLLYKDEAEVHTGIRRSRYKGVRSCCFSLLQLFHTSSTSSTYPSASKGSRSLQSEGGSNVCSLTPMFKNIKWLFPNCSSFTQGQDYRYKDELQRSRDEEGSCSSN